MPPCAAYTLTFGDRAENEKGMQIIGTAAARGVSIQELEAYQHRLRGMGIDSKVVDLGQLIEAKVPTAAVLVIPEGVTKILGEGAALEMLKELDSMPKDKTSLMYGRVVKKHARHNNCMADYDQKPRIAKGKGTVVKFEDYPVTKRLRDTLTRELDAPTPLVGELNHYFDSAKCGIGFHGDAERRLVVGVRLGKGSNGLPLKFQWHRAKKAVGKEGRLVLNQGDIYIMSEKAVGTDWLRSSIYTLRHAAGKDSCKYAYSKKRTLDEVDAAVLYP